MVENRRLRRRKSVSFIQDEDADEDVEAPNTVSRKMSNESSGSVDSASSGADGRESAASKDLSKMKTSHENVSRTTSANIIIFNKTDSRGQLQRLPGESVEIKADDSIDPW